MALDPGSTTMQPYTPRTMFMRRPGDGLGSGVLTPAPVSGNPSNPWGGMPAGGPIFTAPSGQPSVGPGGPAVPGSGSSGGGAPPGDGSGYGSTAGSAPGGAPTGPNAGNSINKWTSLGDNPNGSWAGYAPQYDSTGKPIKTPYYGTTDSSGQLLDKYKLDNQGNVNAGNVTGDLSKALNGIQLNTQGLQTMRDFATGSGDSPWAKMQLQALDQNKSDAMGGAASSAAGATATAQGNLAMRGGLTSGATERLQTAGAKNAAEGQQGVQSQYNTQAAGIRSQDESNRLGMLSQLPGQEVNALSPDLQKTNTWASMANNDANRGVQTAEDNRNYSTGVQQYNADKSSTDIQNRNSYNLGTYGQLMQAWGANQTANAQAGAGGGLSWVCSEVHAVEPLTMTEWKALLKFKKYVAKAHKVASNMYYDFAQTLLPAMKQAGVEFEHFRPFVKETIRLVKEGKMESAFAVYRDNMLAIWKIHGSRPHMMEATRHAV